MSDDPTDILAGAQQIGSNGRQLDERVLVIPTHAVGDVVVTS